MRIDYLSPKLESPYNPGWSRNIEVDGVEYWVGVRGVKKVRIPFKPSGPKGWGWVWEGYVRDANGCDVWCDRVIGSLGARGLLVRAGILKEATQ